MQIVKDFEGDEFERNDGKRKRERSERGDGRVRERGREKKKRNIVICSLANRAITSKFDPKENADRN